MSDFIFLLFTIVVGVGFGTSITLNVSRIARVRLGITASKARWLVLFFICCLVVISFYDTPFEVRDYIFVERDIPNRSATIHSIGACPMIDKAYDIEKVDTYIYTPYVDRFCKRCMYESDVIKLTKGDNKMSHTKSLGL